MSNQNFNDEVIICADCGREFVFSAEDQEFYQNKGYSAPRRCPECRKNRKQQKNGGFQGGRGGARSNFHRQQYDAICSVCGCETKVPFEPSPDKPVYCQECFRKQKGY